MECTAKVFANGDPDKLAECLAPEDKTFDRSTFTVNKKDGGVEFDITAKDAVALRATLNTISQLLIIYEGAAKKTE